MRKLLENTGFTRPAASKVRSRALAALITSAGLAFATIVTATVITAGIARANVVDGVIGNEGSVFVIALILGLAFIGIGGVTLPGSRSRKH